MAEPIANDWKAINDRLQQIQAERSAFFKPCPTCNGLGWIPDLWHYGGRSREARVIPCSMCRNPKDLAPPQLIPRR